MTLIDGYPNIRKTALLIAHDRGMINRFQSEAVWLKRQDAVLGADGIYDVDLKKLDAWLGGVESRTLATIVMGDRTEMEAVITKGPLNSDGIPLARIFDDMFG